MRSGGFRLSLPCFVWIGVVTTPSRMGASDDPVHAAGDVTPTPSTTSRSQPHCELVDPNVDLPSMLSLHRGPPARFMGAIVRWAENLRCDADLSDLIAVLRAMRIRHGNLVVEEPGWAVIREWFQRTYPNCLSVDAEYIDPEREYAGCRVAPSGTQARDDFVVADFGERTRERLLFRFIETRAFEVMDASTYARRLTRILRAQGYRRTPPRETPELREILVRDASAWTDARLRDARAGLETLFDDWSANHRWPIRDEPFASHDVLRYLHELETLAYSRDRRLVAHARRELARVFARVTLPDRRRSVSPAMQRELDRLARP